MIPVLAFLQGVSETPGDWFISRLVIVGMIGLGMLLIIWAVKLIVEFSAWLTLKGF